MSGFNWSGVLPFIITASTALTVVVGLIGLRQGHYLRGRLTARGKRSVAFIVSLGLVTLVSTFVSQQISAAKEKYDGDVRAGQFSRQMESLQRVTNDLGAVRGSLEGSLRRQEQLYGVASQNLRMNGELQQQTQTNTFRVLRQLFTESNRIAAERIAVTVSYQCTRPDRWHGTPEITRALLIVGNGLRDELRLVTAQTLALNDGLVFHGFQGDLGRFEAFPSWRSARVTIRLIANGPESDGVSLSEFNGMTDEEFRLATQPSPPQICPAVATLILNGHQVLASSSTLRQDGQGNYQAEFRNLRVDPARLPHFSE